MAYSTLRTAFRNFSQAPRPSSVGASVELDEDKQGKPREGSLAAQIGIECLPSVPRKSDSSHEIPRASTTHTSVRPSRSSQLHVVAGGKSATEMKTTGIDGVDPVVVAEKQRQSVVPAKREKTAKELELEECIGDIHFIFASTIDEELELYQARDLNRSRLDRALRRFEFRGLPVERKRTLEATVDTVAHSQAPTSVIGSMPRPTDPFSTTNFTSDSHYPLLAATITTDRKLGSGTTNGLFSSIGEGYEVGDAARRSRGGGPGLSVDAKHCVTTSVASSSGLRPSSDSSWRTSLSVPSSPSRAPLEAPNRPPAPSTDEEVGKWIEERQKANTALDNIGLSENWLKSKKMTSLEQRVHARLYGRKEDSARLPSRDLSQIEPPPSRCDRSARRSKIDVIGSFGDLLSISAGAGGVRGSSDNGGGRASSGRMGSGRSSSIANEDFRGMAMAVLEEFLRTNRWDLYKIFLRRSGIEKHYLMSVSDVCRILEQAGGLAKKEDLEVAHVIWKGTLAALSPSQLRRLVSSVGADRNGQIDYRALLDDHKVSRWERET